MNLSPDSANQRRTRGLVAVVIGTLVTSASVIGVLVLGAAAPAGAETRVRLDPRHDVQTVDIDTADLQKVPKQANGDIKRVRISYADRWTRVKLVFRELDHSAPTIAYGVTIRTADGSADVAVKATRGHWRGRVFYNDLEGCAVRRHIDYGTNEAAVAFPSRCLGGAAWIKINAVALTTDHMNNPTYMFFDSFPGTSAFGEAFSKRIHRG